MAVVTQFDGVQRELRTKYSIHFLRLNVWIYSKLILRNNARVEHYIIVVQRVTLHH